MKNDSFTTRVISGIVLVAILLAVGIAGNALLLLFCLIVATVGMKELYMAVDLYDKAAADKKDNMLAMTGVVMCALYFILSGFLSPVFTGHALSLGDMMPDALVGMLTVTELIQFVNTLGYMAASFIYVFIVIIVMAMIYVFTFPRFDFLKISYAIVGAIYTPLFVTAIYLIRCKNDGVFLFWLIFISSWVCDTCAYLVGRSIGKHKLAPVLSPKKSIEGAVGGVAGAVLVAFIFGYFIQYKLCGGSNNVLRYMIICFFGSIFSQIGDLFASAIKRNHNIKDYGTLIPGHGGILDRFDSVIFVAPIIYVLAACLC